MTLNVMVGTLDRALHTAIKPPKETRAALPEFTGSEPYVVGYIHSPVPGRTDKLPSYVPANCYVLPADFVSAIGEGNSVAGGELLERFFHSGPYGAPHRRDGGRVQTRPCILAGGEFIVGPEAVAKQGRGDADVGHDVLDRLVVRVRKRLVSTLKALPGPKKS